MWIHFHFRQDFLNTGTKIPQFTYQGESLDSWFLWLFCKKKDTEDRSYFLIRFISFKVASSRLNIIMQHTRQMHNFCTPLLMGVHPIHGSPSACSSLSHWVLFTLGIRNKVLRCDIWGSDSDISVDSCLPTCYTMFNLGQHNPADEGYCNPLKHLTYLLHGAESFWRS